jgi:hypothetical protein
MAKASSKAAAKPKAAPKKVVSAAEATEAAINEMDPPTRAHAKATKEQFAAADHAARRAISGF